MSELCNKIVGNKPERLRPARGRFVGLHKKGGWQNWFFMI